MRTKNAATTDEEDEEDEDEDENDEENGEDADFVVRQLTW